VKADTPPAEAEPDVLAFGMRRGKESFVDPEELKRDWAGELDDGTIDGLVLCQALHHALGLGGDYIEFQPGYLWIPYRGEPPSALTAD
jgi:hypothetical protein